MVQDWGHDRFFIVDEKNMGIIESFRLWDENRWPFLDISNATGFSWIKTRRKIARLVLQKVLGC